MNEHKTTHNESDSQDSTTTAKIVLIPELQQAADELGYAEWTDIQLKTIPSIQKGLDIIGQSQTGSGKTAAFGMPMLEKVIHGAGLQALILVPTRELCEQVTNELKKFSKHRRMNILPVYGGVSINPQMDYLPRTDIVVATPGRTLDHLNRNTINLTKVKLLVLDEADKMFEMGFVDDVQKIISYIPKPRQTLLFSATISEDVMMIVKKHMNHPTKIKVQSYIDSGKLVQHYYDVEQNDKFSLLMHMIKTDATGLTIIFCSSRRMVDVLHKNLHKQNIESLALHGGLTQARRRQSLDMFHHGKANILVASDVAARGLDIKNVGHIINYDLPKTSNEYIHRVGRTARAGSEGKVLCLLSRADWDNFSRVLQDPSIQIEKIATPKFEKVQFTMGGDRRPFRGNQPSQRRFGSPRGHSDRPQSGGHGGPRRFGH